MVSMADQLLQVEKAWLLSQIGTYIHTCRYRYALLIHPISGLIPDCDDDVMDEVCFHEVPKRRTQEILTFIHSIAKMEFLLLVTFTGVCESTEGTNSCFGRRGNRRRITSSFDSLCEFVHP